MSKWYKKVVENFLYVTGAFMGKTYTADVPFKSAQHLLRSGKERAIKRSHLEFEELTALDVDIREIDIRNPKSLSDVRKEIQAASGWLDK